MISPVDEIQRLVHLEACHFAELLGTLYTLRFTGTIQLHMLNGTPQAAELGSPVIARFLDHPANKGLDRGPKPAPHSPVDASPSD